MFTERPLYLVTDGGQLRSQEQLIPTIDLILRDFGRRIFAVQLREQLEIPGIASITEEELLLLGKELRNLTRPYSVKLIVSRRLDLAVAIDADGVHLASDLERAESARSELGAAAIIGYSAHSLADISAAIMTPIDYVLLGPIYAPLSKPLGSNAPLGPLILSEAARLAKASEMKIFALGGVTVEKLAEIVQSEVAGFATIGAVFRATNAVAATRELLTEWDRLERRDLETSNAESDKAGIR